MTDNPTRRSFLKQTAIVTAAALAMPQLVSAAEKKESSDKIKLKKDDIVLFQGDSITDWGRSRSEVTGSTVNALGNGYAFLSSAELLFKYPDKNLQLYNRGVSGNKVFQLADRWDADCLALKPDVLSILVGINDFWHTLTSGYKGTIETYRDDYKKLLDRTLQALPNVKLIIGEPFLAGGVRPEQAYWYPMFNNYRFAAREMADAYHATFIPYQNIFDDAQKLAPGKYWTIDGVHPSIAGASMMAQAWLETVGA